MIDPADPQSPDESTPPVPGDDEAARLLEVGLTGDGGSPRRPAATTEEMAVHFPDLELVEVLGQGGMGVVYRARQRKLDRLVALKVLPRELSEDPAFAERFAREARTLARLHHPHIVGVHEFGERDGLYFLVMEFVDGVTLRHLMQGGEITPREALAIVPQICEALQYAHDEGVVHRDIKPENILLDRSGRVKVADFGLAKLVERAPGEFTLTGTDQVMGTLHYMAPEQYKTPQDVDHRADIFSLGVVFYEMLTGELPMGRFGKPSEGNELDVRIDDIVMRALERERDLRYQQAADVEEDVKTVTDAPVDPTPEGGHPPPLPRTREADAARMERAAAYLSRPLSRWTLWALILVPVSLAAGFGTYGIVYNIASTTSFPNLHGGHTNPGYYASICGLWTGIGMGLVTFVLSLTAVVRTARARDRFRGLTLAIACLVIAMIGTSVAMSALVQETRDHRRGFEPPWDRPPRTVTWRPPVEVRGASGAAAQREIEAEIRKMWDQYAGRVKVRDLDVSDLQAAGLITEEDVIRLVDMEPAEFDSKREDGELGMGFVGAETFEVPPHRFEPSLVEVDRLERRATVTARMSSHLRPTHDLYFFVQRTDEGWVFSIDKVRFEKR